SEERHRVAVLIQVACIRADRDVYLFAFADMHIVQVAVIQRGAVAPRYAHQFKRRRQSAGLHGRGSRYDFTTLPGIGYTHVPQIVGSPRRTGFEGVLAREADEAKY